eukprot:UN24052
MYVHTMYNEMKFMFLQRLLVNSMLMVCMVWLSNQSCAILLLLIVTCSACMNNLLFDQLKRRGAAILMRRKHFSMHKKRCPFSLKLTK